jgi:hypothetical protein
VTCDLPVRECLAWHYAEHLAQAKLTNGGRSIRARCPVCDGDRRSLTISAGEHLRTVWHCFHKPPCDGSDIRRALLTAGVPSGCLPPGDGTERSRADIVAAVLRSGTRHDRANTILRAYAVLQGHTRWPRGRELERLAAEIDISRRDAYRAASAGPLLPPLTISTTPPGGRLRKEPQVTSARRVSGEVPPAAQAPPTAQPKVPPTAQQDSPPGRIAARERRREQ